MQPLKLRFKKTRQFAIVAKWLLDSASHSFEAIPTNMTTSGSGLKTVSQRVKRLTEQNVIAKPHGLTYKSFLDAACKKAGLRAYEIYLRPTQKAWRYVFATEAFVAWIGARLPEIAANHEPDEDPLNIQVEAELSGFCYGYELRSHLDSKWLEPRANHVWELKTPSFRLFGWFPAKDYFVVHCAEEKNNLTTRGN